MIIVDIFDVWGIYDMGLFFNSFRNENILTRIHYVSKWVEVIPIGTNETRVVISFIRENIFAQYKMLLPSLVIKGLILTIGTLMLC